MSEPNAGRYDWRAIQELWQPVWEKLVPVRYGTSSDVQLWNTTNLMVQYVLARLPGFSP